MKKKRKHNKYRSTKPPASGRKPSSKLAARDVIASAEALKAYHHLFTDLFQRREQVYWSLFYLCGQLAELERKTIEPMVLALLGAQANAIRALQHYIGQSLWEVGPLCARYQHLVAEWLGDPEGVVIADGSGFPKQGPLSVGVARQYCGHLGKVANCQEGVFLVYASQLGNVFLDERLYVHESWFAPEARDRWQACGIPEETPFRTEPELALEMIRNLVEQSQLPFRWITADERFGQNPAFLQGISQLGKWYLVEVPADTRFWKRRPPVEPPGPGLLGRPRLYPRVAKTAPVPQAIAEIAAQLTPAQWSRHFIKEGSKGPMWADFAFLRLIPVQEKLPGPTTWVIIRRALRAPHEEKYYLSNAPARCALTTFVWLSGMRWPIETALEEAKGEVGMDHYETRTWLGWHHHLWQTLMAHLFLIRLRHLFKKKSGAYHRPNTSVGSAGDCRRVSTDSRCYPRHPLSATEKLCRLLLPSQTHAPTLSPTSDETQIARNLVVM